MSARGLKRLDVTLQLVYFLRIAPLRCESRQLLLLVSDPGVDNLNLIVDVLEVVTGLLPEYIVLNPGRNEHGL